MRNGICKHGKKMLPNQTQKYILYMKLHKVFGRVYPSLSGTADGAVNIR